MSQVGYFIVTAAQKWTGALLYLLSGSFYMCSSDCVQVILNNLKALAVILILN